MLYCRLASIARDLAGNRTPAGVVNAIGREDSAHG